MNRCPYDNNRLTVDQTFTDSRPDGLGPYGAEVSYRVVVWACPSCGFTHKEVDE